MKLRFSHVLLSLSLCLISASSLTAQVVTCSSIFPNRHSTVTITYDATQGNAALTGVSPIYAHTGLITDRSQATTPPTWQYTQGNWGTADTHVLMNSLGNNKFSITYNIDSFYGDNLSDTILDLAFVFRNADGSIVGRTAAGTDIYLPMYNDSLHCAFMSPASGSFTQASLNSTMNFFCAASQNCTLTLYSNGNQLAQVTNDSLFYNNFTFLSYGDYHFVLVADNGVQVTSDSIDVIVTPTVTQQDPPAGTIEGINYVNDSTVILCLLAPYKTFAYVIGDFNNWQLDNNYFMKQALDGQRWWQEVDHLTPGKEYIFQYDVNGIRIGDPYCDKVSDPDVDPTITQAQYPNLIQYPFGKTTGIASVLQTAQVPYQWQNTSFVKPNKHNLVVYECLVRDFVPQHYWAVMIDSLPYLQKLGINAIELLPIMNFESNASWGYNPNYFCAPDKTYGPKDELKRFIDTCHSRGIAVLFDIAFNDAFGTCPMVKLYWDAVNQQPAANNPWFNQVAPHPYSVGYDFNHNTPYTQHFLDRVTKYWIQEYHADGYRFDLTKGYTQFYSGNDVGLWAQYDTMRVRLLERMVDQIWSVDTSSIIVFEELADNDEETELQGHNKGIMLWGNMNTEYNQCTMGYSSNDDVSWVSYQARGWGNANLVGYMESHDEERLMYNNELYGDSITGYDVKSLDTGLARMECAGALFFPVPGPKMIWQFGERGYDISINQFCRICAKPMHWEYMKNPNRVHQYKVWAALIKLKTTYAPFGTANYDIDMSNLVKRIRLYHPQFNVISVGNFDVVSQNAYPVFGHTGWWYEYFTGDSVNVSDVNMAFNLKPGGYKLFTDTRLPAPDLTVPSVVTPNGIDEIVYTHDNISVYPSPTSGRLNFVSGDGKSIGKIDIYDLQGREVYAETVSANQPFIAVNLPGDMTNGLYLYTVSVAGTLHNGRFVYTQ